MRKPVVDYRQFRLSRLGEPQFSHLKLLWGWVGYFTLYFLTEALIPADNCYVVYHPLDDLIPFCEVFIIPYVGWYVLIVASLLYFMLYNVDSFKKLSKFIIITQVCAMVIYILFPTRQDLRPVEFPRDNVFTWIINILYTFDTNTNVCPSLHVGYSIGIASVWAKEKDVSPWIRALIIIFCILVCLSTAFIKQHSVVDAFVAMPICLAAEIFLYKDYYKQKFRRKR